MSRPLIALLDECHISWSTKEILVTAFAIDANNTSYPLAYVVVKGENKSQSWFLKNLRDNLGLDNGYGFLILCDKQKGLIQAIQRLLQSVDMFYFVHLYYFKVVGYMHEFVIEIIIVKWG